MSTVYWKGGTQEQTQSDKPNKTSKKSAPNRKIHSITVEDSEEEPQAPKSKPASKEATRKPSTKAKGIAKPLFISSDEEDTGVNNLSDLMEESDTAVVKPANRKAKGGAKSVRRGPAAVVADDDSDDGTAFKGFRKRK